MGAANYWTKIINEKEAKNKKVKEKNSKDLKKKENKDVKSSISK
jgi:hypothetical protein